MSFQASLGGSALALASVVSFISVSAPAPARAQTGRAPVPLPLRPSQAQDLGPTDGSQIITASMVLKVRDPDALERAVASSEEPSSGAYHRFISVGDFVARYSPSASDIATIERTLDRFGIRVTDVYADHLLLKVAGTVDAFNRLLGTVMHDYQQDGKRFHCPKDAPAIPTLLRDLLLFVGGLSDEAQFHPMHVRARAEAGLSPAVAVLPPAGSTATGVPGSYTVGDVANFYDVNPLYRAHIDGAGSTIGVATLASFHPQDAYNYWKLIGLDVPAGRITEVHVDGGGELSAAAGSSETSLDVEQSGGLAPRAKVIVYDAPNTDAGFIDVFYKAASDNLVDSLSVSWGLSEVWYYAGLRGTDATPMLVAFHQAFLEAAVQGISLFAASGDDGAYAANTGFDQPFLNVLSVESPASDPALTAAGGTTTPFSRRILGQDLPPLHVTSEQVWGWDYFQDYLVSVLGAENQDSQFPVGGGGGVSTFWAVPGYQTQTHGVRVSEAGQSVVFVDGDGAHDLLDLPAGFAGRNLPDVALGADPLSGFVLLDSTEGSGPLPGWGGTSFVAPQLNGIGALIVQAAGGRVGLWNPMLYRFQKTFAHGPSSPITDIVAGDNWFYGGEKGYEPGAGLGVLDVANLEAAIRSESLACH